MRTKYKTDIERIMGKALDKNNIQAAYDFPIRCKYGYRIDFVITSKKIGIECDGEAWHKENNHHDRKRDHFLKRMGWKMIRFPCSRIKQDINSCIDEIKKLMEAKNGKNKCES